MGHQTPPLPSPWGCGLKWVHPIWKCSGGTHWNGAVGLQFLPSQSVYVVVDKYHMHESCCEWMCGNVHVGVNSTCAFHILKVVIHTYMYVY